MNILVTPDEFQSLDHSPARSLGCVQVEVPVKYRSLLSGTKSDSKDFKT